MQLTTETQQGVRHGEGGGCSRRQGPKGLFRVDFKLLIFSDDRALLDTMVNWELSLELLMSSDM